MTAFRMMKDLRLRFAGFADSSPWECASLWVCGVFMLILFVSWFVIGEFVFLVSKRLQTREAKSRNGFFSQYRARRLRVPQSVVHPELVPLESSQLMERQHVHSFDVAETAGELCHTPHFRRFVGPSGHQHEPNPDGPMQGGQTPRKFQNRFVRLPRKALVQIG